MNAPSIRKVFLGLVLSSLFIPLAGQLPHFQSHYLGRILQRNLPKTVFADQQSRLWLTAGPILYLYDNKDPQIFERPDTSAANLTAVYQAQDSTIWLGYEDGAIYYLSFGALQEWKIEEGHPQSPITGFAQDRQGQLWIATYGEGLYCYARRKRLYHFGPEDGLISQEIYDISSDRQGRIWAGTDAGIAVTAFVDERKRLEFIRPVDGLADEIVLQLAASENGMWIGTHQGGLSFYDLEQADFCPLRQYRATGPIISLANVSDQECYFINEDGQAHRFREQKVDTVGLLDEQTELATSLSLDPEGNIWIVSRSHHLYSGHLRLEFVAANLPEVQALSFDSSGQLWLGTQEGLYSTHDFSNNQYTIFPESRTWNILAIHPLQLQNEQGQFLDHLLVGTFDQGIFLCQGDNIRHLTEAQGLANNSVLSICHTEDTVWIATLGGISYLPTQELLSPQPKLTKVKDLGSNFIYQVVADPKAGIWLATDGDGLIHYQRGRPIKRLNPTTHNEELTNTILGVQATDTGLFWFNSQGSGMYAYQADSLFRPPRVNTIGNSTGGLSAFFVDANEQLAAIYSRGLDLLSADFKHWLSFGEESGFRGTGPSLNAVAKDKQGNAYFWADEQLIRYRSSIGWRQKLLLEIESVQASGQEQLNSDHRFAHFQNQLRFKYMGNWLSDPQAVSYRYRLLGLNPEWIYARDRSATYSNLDAGSYTFELQASLYNQFNTATSVRYSFTILRPWWQQWWSISIVFLSIFFFGHYLLGRRNKSREKELRLEQERIHNELAVLKAQINPHFLFNSFSTLIATIEHSPSMGIAYTEQLAEFFRRVLKYRDLDLIPLAEELEVVDNYFFLLQKRFGKKLQLRIDRTQTSGSLPPLCLQILIENAVKHNIISERFPLTISIVREGRKLKVCNPIQPKRKKEEGSGFGLEAIRRRYQLLGNEMISISESNEEFCVELPIL